VEVVRLIDAETVPALVPGGESVGSGALGAPTVDASALVVLEFMAAVPCVVRDEDLRVRWCNDAYAALSKQPPEELLGSQLEDFQPSEAAKERIRVIRQVLETGRRERYYQVGADRRLLCSLLPIDPVSFGHRGVLIMIQQETGLGCQCCEPGSIPVLSTPLLDELGVLSPAELRVLLHLGKGRTTAEIGGHLSRSAKTIEKQIESIHRKLDTGSRAELVRLAVERGLQAFADGEWERIIEGAKAVKRSSN